MRRDWLLIRRLLAHIAETADGQCAISIGPFYDYKDDEITYHVRLCAEAGFVILARPDKEPPQDQNILRLTWAGHDKLEELGGGRWVKEHDPK